MDMLAIFGVASGWAAPLGGLIAWLHHRRIQASNQLRDQFLQELRAIAASSERAHNELSAQVKDISRTVQEHFVRRRELDGAMVDVKQAVADTRREIGVVRNEIGLLSTRIDRVFEARRDG